MAQPVYARKKTPRRALRTKGRSPDLHCMLVPTGQDLLLLPTSVMVEVVDYQQPAAMQLAPPWLLGHIEWESRQVPVFSFSDLINGTEPGEVAGRSKIMILKSLTESGRVPYLGLVLRGLPRPINIKPEGLEETGDEKKSLGVFRRVQVEESDAIIPDLDRLTHLVTHAVFGALPITRLDS